MRRTRKKRDEWIGGRNEEGKEGKREFVYKGGRMIGVLWCLKICWNGGKMLVHTCGWVVKYEEVTIYILWFCLCKVKIILLYIV